MAYYNYHASIKRMIEEKKLIGWYYTDKHNAITPALVLLFNDFKHPVMPLRQNRWKEYEFLLPEDKQIYKK